MARRQKVNDLETSSPFSREALRTRGALAVLAYWFSVGGLIPPLGALLGPIAVLLGARAKYQLRADPEHLGRPLADAALILGGSLWVTTWLGLWLIYLSLK